MDQEFLKALELVAEYDAQRPKPVIEPRLYYDDHGNITMYCETDHPADTRYIVLDNPDIYFKNNTHHMKVVNGKLMISKPSMQTETRLTKSHSGQAVVRGIAALALRQDETYTEIEYYDKKYH